MSAIRLWSVNLGGGGSVDPGTLIGSAGSAAISNGANTVSVVYGTAFDNTNYALVCQIRNTVDADPIFLNIVDTAKSTTGFTLTFNTTADSANYLVDYLAAGNV